MENHKITPSGVKEIILEALELAHQSDFDDRQYSGVALQIKKMIESGQYKIIEVLNQ